MRGFFRCFLFYGKVLDALALARLLFVLNEKM